MQPFRTMLFAADFSENSKEAFRIACSLAVENKTRMFVLHVDEPGLVAEEPATKESGHEALMRQLREVYAPNHPVDVEYRTNKGDAAEEILRMAEKIGADLIVMGTHGRRGLRRLLAGSVATTVLRGAHCAVLALRSHDRPREAGEVQVILHPTDLSESSDAVLRVGRSLARDLGSRLVLLHVVPIPNLPGEWALPVDMQAYRNTLEAVRERLNGPDLKYPVEARLGEGDPANEILQMARELGADLIVMGTQGRTGLDRLILGSTAESVLARADCPVMVVKAPRHASTTTHPADEKVASIH
ncbi:MAG: universal stress protein [Isosphaeraceae bacterium]